MSKLTRKQIIDIAKNIKLLILDVDGVLTDGSIIIDNNGNEIKSFHVRDGHGIVMLLRKGIKVALITGRYSKIVEIRARELGIKDVFQRCREKESAYKMLANKYKLKNNEIACMGDDVVDIELLKMCGLPIAVADAHREAKMHSIMITKEKGGKGAVREVCDFILKAKGF
ncbi:MAG: HAD-IIIA family hydrolase [Nitrospirae bacterium]|jgi:3-deoxy-D-manno-octulosonate 8-phosphate phosphatase (KDO 8-P phosphatase)|nr:HAD-IIIA family hydrolase [Nitrospirota bacterium]